MRMMSKMKQTHLCLACIIWLAAYTGCSVEATYKPPSRNPLLGSLKEWPTSGPAWAKYGGGVLDFENLTRLLDVGAAPSRNSNLISIVPPLDGTGVFDTLSQHDYAMQLVFFDLELVELKGVDPLGGSFQVEIQMVLHWIETVTESPLGTELNDTCQFPCGTNYYQTPLCCDEVWVPPLHLPRCDISKIESSTPTPNFYTVYPMPLIQLNECATVNNTGHCVWRRLWYLNFDATCASEMDFHNFPFDVQRLEIEILNPYASRTWFQLTQGFLDINIGENINTINLSPDAKIPGWYIKDLIVSGTCGASKNWKQTFLTQDILLQALNDSYVSQNASITSAWDDETLTCTIMEDIGKSTNESDFLNLGAYTLYESVKIKYLERVSSTLEAYKQCTIHNGSIYSWNSTYYEKIGHSSVPYFQPLVENIKRSFNFLDLVEENTKARVSFPCAISAIANLTTPGIKVTIVVQRYRLFYVLKLLLPTIACVAFSFAAFGLHPTDLVGRLTVVVPSAIALTALQGIVVSTDIPPVAYIAPTTYIFLLSYVVQVLISFESILVSCLHSDSLHQRRNVRTRWREINLFGFLMKKLSKKASKGLTSKTSKESTNRDEDASTLSDKSIELPVKSSSHEVGETRESGLHSQGKEEVPSVKSQKSSHRLLCGMDSARELDFILMVFLSAIYIGAILLCIFLPMNKSSLSLKEHSTSHGINGISIWKKN